MSDAVQPSLDLVSFYFSWNGWHAQLHARWDDAARVWVIDSSGFSLEDLVEKLPRTQRDLLMEGGSSPLVTEAPSLDELAEKLPRMLQDLMME